MTARTTHMPNVTEGIAVIPQEFETAIFGAPVWRLDVTGKPSATAEDFGDVVSSAAHNGVCLVYCRVAAESSAGDNLGAAGFRQVERLQTFGREIPSYMSPVDGIDLAGEGDADECAEIGRTTFEYDRYHADAHVPDRIADEIKARWARNGVLGRADKPLVARDGDGRVAGFILCLRRHDTAVIDLISVCRDCQGQGIGRRLVESALAHYAGDADRIIVGTQEANTASQVLYRRTGFSLMSEADTWHWTPHAS